MNGPSRRYSRIFPILLLLLIATVLLREANNSKAVPVLLYHHFVQESTSDLEVTPEQFREQMTALKRAGFNAITLQQMLAYVEEGSPLPKNPVLITMDDGYTSNLSLAAPILEETGMCATIFVIGINEGKNFCVHTGNPLHSDRFSYEDAAVWVEKGIIDLQCHTYDMHQLSDQGISGRDGMLPLAEEDAAAYRAALRADLTSFRQQRENRVSTALMALAYPYGYYTEELDNILSEEGISVTFTTQEVCPRLQRGDPTSLRMLGRFNVTERCSGQQLVQRLRFASIDFFSGF